MISFLIFAVLAHQTINFDPENIESPSYFKKGSVQGMFVDLNLEKGEKYWFSSNVEYLPNNEPDSGWPSFFFCSRHQMEAFCSKNPWFFGCPEPKWISFVLVDIDKTGAFEQLCEDGFDEDYFVKVPRYREFYHFDKQPDWFGTPLTPSDIKSLQKRLYIGGNTKGTVTISSTLDI